MLEKQMLLDKLYMDLALRIKDMSKANRKKVGGILVKDNNIVSFGWNGTPFGFDNACEDIDGNTISEVIHAEFNIIAKAAKQGISTNNTVLYITLSPCFECAKLLIQAGISKIIFYEEYRDDKPINFLSSLNIYCHRYEFIGEIDELSENL